tara:strand:- start:373 stop:540 length:168 start_codon:yes stop_codon:yes gene_type:complete
MALSNELARIKKRLQKIVQIEQPPNLRMVFIGASGDRPEDFNPSSDLLLHIEKKI